MAADESQLVKRRAEEVIARCVAAIRSRDPGLSNARIAVRMGWEESTVQAVLGRRRTLQPDFLRDLAGVAGLSVVELFSAMGWVPEAEVGSMSVPAMASEVSRMAVTLDRMRPLLELVTAEGHSAPATAVEALGRNARAAERFEARLGWVHSGARYRAITDRFAEFLPLADPLPYGEAVEMARAEGLVWRPSQHELADDPGFASIRLELAALTHRALSDAREWSWQGGHDHRTWQREARLWPSHLLVEDAIGGQQRPEAADPAHADGPIVAIGGRHGLGMSDQILAAALGWQYVLVRADVGISPSGHVFHVPRDPLSGRTLAWSAVAAHVRARHEARDPWRAVILVRPAAFAGPSFDPVRYALKALAGLPCRVLYAPPPLAFLTSWAERIAGDHRPGEYDTAAWLARTRSLYSVVERELAGRVGDLRFTLPPLLGELTGDDPPSLPAPVLDWSVRLAEAARRRLASDHPVRAGLLHDHHLLLATDPLVPD
ncbi:hypothetical protein GCM10027589_58130 [Actinocorallia lasiicapitis]